MDSAEAPATPSDDDGLVGPPLVPTVPFTGEMTFAGREAEGGLRGHPAISDVSLVLDDGSAHEFGGPPSGEVGRVTPLTAIPELGFLLDGRPACPICLGPNPSHREHVPQGDLGGHKMTYTCQRCNNGLGSTVEVDLLHWFDSALVQVAFDHDGDVPGRRRLPKLYYLENNVQDEFMLLVDGELSPEVRQIMDSGSWRMSHRRPDPRRYKLALLKHAYLSACLLIGGIPGTPDAEAIRADLVAARDRPRRERPPESEAAMRLRVYRSGVGPQGPRLAAVARAIDDDTEPEVMLSLAGALFVSWPIADFPPGTWQPVDDESDAERT